MEYREPYLTNSTEEAEIKPGTWLVVKAQKSKNAAGTASVIGTDDIRTCVSYEDYRKCIDAALNVPSESELYFFIVLWVSGEDRELPVLGNKLVLECNLLAPFRRKVTEDNATRPDIHVFFLTVNFINQKESTEIEISDLRSEGEKMLPELKGVTLYKFHLNSCPDEEEIRCEMKRLFNAASLTASEICTCLMDDASKIAISKVDPLKVGLPNGRSLQDPLQTEDVSQSSQSKTESPGKNDLSDDFTLLINLRGNEANGDIEAFREICSLLRIKKERRLSISREDTWTEESAKKNVDENCEIIKKHLIEENTVGKIWVFVTAHGDHRGVETSTPKIESSTPSTCFTPLDKLLASLFLKLYDKEKLIFVDACRGARDNPGQTLTHSPRCSRGLMFSNQTIDSKAESLDGCFISSSRSRYFAIYACLPGYKTTEYIFDDKRVGHLMMSTKAAMESLRGKAVSREELAEVIQCKLANHPSRGTKLEETTELQLIIQKTLNVSSETSKNDDDPIIPKYESEQQGSTPNADGVSGAVQQPGENSLSADPKDDLHSTRQITLETSIKSNQQNIEIAPQVSSSSTDSSEMSSTSSAEQ
ncbi:hypothetical protein BOX15_Mlig010853g1 [Macrostomum lignano]|uniref:Caspase family p20 domain-containing protein n=1 Tax=Macrostomum lignano TaxID=282301 RepID=A0A267F775_9PLAT|nr:hypothetical protein BOX15_Mlig010853g1 [Macrostomum lignano]